MPAKALTIRDLPESLSRALDAERKRRGTSLNQTVKDLLAQSLGLPRGKRWSNGLAQLAGTWSQEDLDEFERNTTFLEEVDPEMWK